MQSGEDERPGPVPVPGDSWLDAPTSARHRLSPPRRPLRYLWVLVVLGAIAVVPTVAVPLLTGEGGEAPDLTAAVTSTPATLRSGSGAPSGPGLALVTAPPGVSATPPAGGPPGGTRSGPSTTSALPAPSLPLALEAEGAGLMRAKVEAIDAASGGHGARFTGTPGRVRYSSLAVATGTYRVTIAYAPGAQASATVQGVDGQVAITFAAGSGCCATVSAQVPLAAGGTLTIRLTSAGGTYPAIDRVVIEQA